MSTFYIFWIMQLIHHYLFFPFINKFWLSIKLTLKIFRKKVGLFYIYLFLIFCFCNDYFTIIIRCDILSRCSIAECLEAASLHPAQALGISGSKGNLNYGSDADLVLLEKDSLDVVSTWIGIVFQHNNFLYCNIYFRLRFGLVNLIYAF